MKSKAEKNCVIERMTENGSWKKTWWTVPEKTWPYPVRIPRVSASEARKCLKRARTAFPDTEYRVAEVKPKVSAKKSVGNR